MFSLYAAVGRGGRNLSYTRCDHHPGWRPTRKTHESYLLEAAIVSEWLLILGLQLECMMIDILHTVFIYEQKQKVDGVYFIIQGRVQLIRTVVKEDGRNTNVRLNVAEYCDK